MYNIKGSVAVERDLIANGRVDPGTLGVPSWATGKVYAVGDLVRDSGILYVATAAHTAGASFVGDAASWGSVSAVSDTVQTLTATGTATAWSSLVLVNSATAATVTLPSATAANIGKRVTIKSLGAGAVTIAPNGADAVQGAAVLAQFEAATYEVSAAATVVRVDNAGAAVTATPLAYFSTGFVGSGWSTGSLSLGGVPITATVSVANTTAPIPFNDALFAVSANVGGFTPTATGITVPATGTYSISYRSDVSTTTTGAAGAQLLVNGAVVNFGKFGENSNATLTDGQLTLQWTGPITAGQTVQVTHVRESAAGTDAVKTVNMVIEQLPTSTVVDPGAVTVTDQAASGYLDVGAMRMQWGQLTNTNDAAQLVTLPAAFASTAYSLSLTPDDGWSVGAGEVTPWKWSGKTTTSFNVDRDDDVTGTALVDWIAIGLRP